MFLLLGAMSGAAALQLQADQRIASAGYFQLSWPSTLNSHARFEIQQADNAAFVAARTVYQGPDRATVLTGLPDGEYFFRARTLVEAQADAQANAWSPVIRVEVRHHSLPQALLFFSIGALVFIVLLIAILRGNRQTHSGAKA